MPDLQRSGMQLVDGPVGAIEVLVDVPAGPSVGIALVAHPQPLLGGHARHKVPQVLARALVDDGWTVLRPHFRGVGGSAGTHDEGLGETEDLLALVARVRAVATPPRLALLGFSFGAFVQARVARALAGAGAPPWRVVLAGLPNGEVDGVRRYPTPSGIADALVVHGELDERVPLQTVLDWARPQDQPVVVVPGADHAFTGKLQVLRTLVRGHLRP